MAPDSTPTGAATWSARTAWREAGVPDRACRAILDRQLLPRRYLTASNLVALRALVALARFPAPPVSVDETLRNERDSLVAPLVEEAWRSGDDATLLLATPLSVRLVRQIDQVPTLLTLNPGVPVLLLPVGAWCRELRTRQDSP